MEELYVLYTRDEQKYRTIIGIVSEIPFNRLLRNDPWLKKMKEYYNVKQLFYRMVTVTMTGDFKLGAARYTI